MFIWLTYLHFILCMFITFNVRLILLLYNDAILITKIRQNSYD
jgi:hypothetical protein